MLRIHEGVVPVEPLTNSSDVKPSIDVRAILVLGQESPSVLITGPLREARRYECCDQHSRQRLFPHVQFPCRAPVTAPVARSSVMISLALATRLPALALARMQSQPATVVRV